MKTSFSNGKVTLSIKPIEKELPVLCTDVIILSKICDNSPISQINSESWSHITNLHLADRNFDRPGNIDLLLGADVFSKILLNGEISGNSNDPDALTTEFGYIVMGKIDISTPSVSSFFIQSSDTVDIEGILKFLLAG
ncbi:hypothetical protein JTB14_010098 [Gonioctena quinquepunctata]|nr:hypothetical protein JTB14_010098 [Gonioctena quinquepunctata]